MNHMHTQRAIFIFGGLLLMLNCTHAQEVNHPVSTLLPDGTAFPFWEDRTTYRDVFHVAATHPRAADANPGTTDEPWKTIGRAAELLQPGQKVVVHAGVYREQVVPSRGGAGPDSMIAYEAAPGEEVIVSGAEEWTPRCLPSAGWHTGKARIWMADLPGEMFIGYNPFLARNIYEEVVSYSNPAEMSRYMLRRGAVFVNGLPLTQVYRFAELTGQDAHSSQAPMDVAFDPATMTLRIACQAMRATSPAVPELGEAGEASVYPGPWDRAASKRLGEGQTVTLSWPVPAGSD